MTGQEYIDFFKRLDELCHGVCDGIGECYRCYFHDCDNEGNEICTLNETIEGLAAFYGLERGD